MKDILLLSRKPCYIINASSDVPQTRRKPEPMPFPASRVHDCVGWTTGTPPPPEALGGGRQAGEVLENTWGQANQVCIWILFLRKADARPPNLSPVGWVTCGFDLFCYEKCKYKGVLRLSLWFSTLRKKSPQPYVWWFKFITTIHKFFSSQPCFCDL